jgi:acetyl esterase
LAEATPSLVPEAMIIRNRFIEVPGRQIALRIYHPEDSIGQPALLFFHGGGWVSGSVFTHDVYAITLAEFCNLPVISVNYRLAPESPYPAALDDCYVALEWCGQYGHVLDIDGSRVAVGGDSAGGNLAAALCLRARDAGGPPIAFQFLVFPCLDTDFGRLSYARAADPGLSREQMIAFWSHYLQGRLDTADYLARPMACPDVSGVPPAYVLTADLDPLRDEGLAFAARLQDAGVPVTARNVNGAIHGFIRARYCSEVVTTEARLMCEAIRNVLLEQGQD